MDSTKKTMPELQRLSVEEFHDSGKIPVILVLDDVRSMNNVGSVFRSADAFRIEGIYLCGYTPQPPHRDIQKTALGATDTVTWKHFSDITEAIGALQNQQYHIYSIEQTRNSIPLHQIPLQPSEKYALILGNEVHGVSDQALASSEACIEIPQFGSKHSLNVAVSAGIVLWEVARSLHIH
ncbi:MAG TPA: RNA methyltransferase [Chitinophagaceae bacterium]|nr:RNA methyltransferase [Chitinophagaceae bacterium]HNF72102.1 RNA methyltransferase [Chitinophagaceae bacterium]